MSAPLLQEAPRSVAVLRALMLGDMLCATPALRALRRQWPRAQITLVGLPWAREWAARLSSVDHFVELPGWPGLPETPTADAEVRTEFVAQMRAQRYELALQLHGSGEVVNPLVAQWQPQRQAGFGRAQAGADPALFVPWPQTGREAQRLQVLTTHLGCAPQPEQLEFPLLLGDFTQARHLRPDAAYAVVHPGSQWPSRRWPPERFAQVADTLAARGLQVVITGTEREAEVARSVAALMRHPAHVLAGHTTLWTLGALVAEAALVVCNDTGISHVAAALRTPSVVVANGSDALRWAPADGLRHRVLWQDAPCRPCGHMLCPHGQRCALAIAAADVARLALQQLDQRRQHTPTPPLARPVLGAAA